jgi:hypothetical protein
MILRRVLPVLILASVSAAFSLQGAQADTLGARITQYTHVHICSGRGCRNAIIVVFANRIKAVRFDGRYAEGATYEEEYLTLDRLKDYLRSMPLSAWPNGPTLWVNESDYEITHGGESDDELNSAKHNQFTAVVRLCYSLGLTPTRKDGTPLQTK